MAKQGISTGTTPNDGTGDSLLTGAEKINDNFDELYAVVGNGTATFVGIVSQITACNNVSISTAYGSVDVGVSTNINTTGIITATGGFVSTANTTPIQITLSGSTLTFTASGIGSTSFTLS